MAMHSFFRNRFAAGSPWCQVAFLLTVLCAPRFASGQHESGECAAAISYVNSGRAQKALGTLPHCPSTGPDAIARAWSRIASNKGEDLQALAGLSRMLRDARVYRAALSAAGETNRPTDQRLEALGVLVSHYDPKMVASSRFLREAAVGDPITRGSHSFASNGTAPLPGSVAADLPALFARLSSVDPDPVIRAAALRLRSAFAYIEPNHTPLEPGSVWLERCGGVVVMKWTTDIGTVLRVRVLGTQFDRSYTPTAASKEQPKQFSLNVPAGTVMVTFGDREIARLEQHSSPCTAS